MTAPTISPSNTAASIAVVEPIAKAPRQRPPLGFVFAVAFIVLLVLVATFADYLPFVRYPTDKVPGGARYKVGPGSEAWFGSDGLSRDVFALCIYGARTSLQIGIFSTALGIIVGGFFGVIAGYYRGWVDRAVSILVDCLLALPALLLAIILVSRLDAVRADQPWLDWFNRKWQIVLTLGILAVAPLARIVRAQTMALRDREFVLAARSLGAKPGRVIWREIMPNLIPPILTVAFTGFSILIASEGALAFLGLGVEVGTPTWGKMINENRNKIDQAWWATIFPCLMLFLTVLSFNVIGDRLSRRFDIRQAGV